MISLVDIKFECYFDLIYCLFVLSSISIKVWTVNLNFMLTGAVIILLLVKLFKEAKKIKIIMNFILIDESISIRNKTTWFSSDYFIGIHPKLIDSQWLFTFWHIVDEYLAVFFLLLQLYGEKKRKVSPFFFTKKKTKRKTSERENFPSFRFYLFYCCSIQRIRSNYFISFTFTILRWREYANLSRNFRH